MDTAPFYAIRIHITRHKESYIIASVMYLFTLSLLIICWINGVSEGMDCGIVSQNMNQFIINGSKAPLGFVPWYVALKRKSLRAPYCGGSIISRDWVITARHCADTECPNRNTDCITIVAGSQDAIENSPGTVHRIVEVKTFESSHNVNLDDIAVLRVSPRFKYRKHGFGDTRGIAPICLPEVMESITEKEAIAAGYGWTSNFHDIAADSLMAVKIKFMDWNYCNYLLKKNPENSLTNITNHICAGDVEEGKSSCRGDSGGPLTTVRRNVQTLIGIASFGIKTGCDQFAYYTNVAVYREWIEDSTGV